MMILLAFISCTFGFTSLALATNRHHRQVADRAPDPVVSRWLRILGVVGLAGSLALCIMVANWANGIVLWFGTATISILGVALMLTYRPALVRVLVRWIQERLAH